MSLLSLSQRRMPAFIAVLAILMLFIAPEVSKTLAQWRAAASAIAAHGDPTDYAHNTASEDSMRAGGMSDGAIGGHSMPMSDGHHPATHDGSMPMHGMASDMPHHAMPAVSTDSAAKTHASQPHDAASMPGMANMDDLACGYCELLVHFPFMLWLLIPLIWLFCTSTRAPPVRLIVSFFATFLPGTCLPRAPPAR
ncbi:DUF2946 family protein [Erwinia sp. JUb26]|uniref:DUF2946 family protein n=1 Tax=Erwinia sp. JUb26 TaxID=2485126 RepID=UPI001F24B80F|nr:DUF2946 family protein [Erwinia sp. JUb26]